MTDKRVCLVTGASYGLGSDIARQLARKGWEVVLVARSKDKLEKVKEEIEAEGGVSMAVTCDITDKESVANLKTAVDTR